MGKGGVKPLGVSILLPPSSHTHHSDTLANGERLSGILEKWQQNLMPPSVPLASEGKKGVVLELGQVWEEDPVQGRAVAQVRGALCPGVSTDITASSG